MPELSFDSQASAIGNSAMNLNLAAALTWLGLPVYLWQGLGVRRRSMRMPSPSPQTVSPVKGVGQPIRLLLVGDSSAAGVGVNDINQSLGAKLVRSLAQQSGRPVEIRIAGCTSATAGQIRDFVLPHIEPGNFTHVVLNIGTNDAKNFHTARRFRREFGSLLYSLNTRFYGARLIWSSILDLSSVPTLPTPLNQILGVRSRLLTRIGEKLCRERLTEIPDGEWRPSRDNFSIDGFHASEKGYQEWAEILATHILSH
jgi:lysophospholipase L1-like esterase